MRFRALAVVLAAFAGLVVAGVLGQAGFSPEGGTSQSVAGQQLLPFVTLSSRSSSVWSCPGPLPVGSNSSYSSIAVMNAGETEAQVSLKVVDLPEPSAKAPTVSGTPTRKAAQLNLGPGQQSIVSLPRTGAAGMTAVTAIASGSAVAVAEIVTPATPPTSGTKTQPGTPPGTPMESACEAGTSVKAYVVPGSTLSQSRDLLSVTNPTATPAVVDVSLLEGTNQSAPSALQGLEVPPGGAVTADLGRYAVQATSLTAIVTAVSGRVAAGAYETIASSSLDGTGLVAAVGRPRTTWELDPGSTAAGRTLNVEIANPSSQSTTVTVSSELVGHPTSQISAQLVPNSAASVAVPLTGDSPVGSGKPATLSEGMISVHASAGVGVVVSTETDLPAVVPTGSSTGTTPREVMIGTPPLTSASTWLLPAGASTQYLSDQVIVCNPTERTAQVSVEQLGGSPSSAPTLGGVSVLPGGCVRFPLGASIADSTNVAVRVVSAGGDVVVSQMFNLNGILQSVAGIPARS